MVDIELRIFVRGDSYAVDCLKSLTNDYPCVQLKYSGTSGAYEVFDIIFKNIYPQFDTKLLIKYVGMEVSLLGEKLLESSLSNRIRIYVRSIGDCDEFRHNLLDILGECHQDILVL